MSIINRSHRFIFVHVPKAAGTSVTRVLSHFTSVGDAEVGGSAFGEAVAEHYAARFGLTKHSTAQEIRAVVGDPMWRSCFTFGFVRNPYARAYSIYTFLRHRFRSWHGSQVMDEFDTFESFVTSEFFRSDGPDRILCPQVHWLRGSTSDDRPCVDYVGRVETIDHDLPYIVDQFIGDSDRAPHAGSIPRVNSSGPVNAWCSAFSRDEVREAVYERFRSDFITFGYSESLDPEPRPKPISNNRRRTARSLPIEREAPIDREVEQLPKVAVASASEAQSEVRFDDVRTPAASIVVPVHGKWKLTLDCLRSLTRERKSRHSFEVIVVDDCSPDDTAPNLRKIAGITTLTSPRNLGFLGASNLGARSARGDVLVFLNNDTIVHEGWLDALLDVLDADTSVGLVGSLLVRADGKVQEAGGIIWDDGTGRNYGRGLPLDRAEVRARRDVDYCSAASVAVRRSLFMQVGGFDSRYSPAYYEDTDLCFAVRSAGYRVVVQPRSVVTHHEGGSHGVDGSGGLKRFQAVNRHIFVRKWRDDLTNQGRPNDSGSVWVARNRRPGGMMLLLDAHVPTPDRDSGSRRMAAIIDQLLDMRMSLYLAPSELIALQPYARDLEDKGVTILATAEDQSRFFREAASRLRAVMVCRPNVMWRYVDRIYKHAPQALLIYDTVDLHSLRCRREAEFSGEPEHARLADLLWTKERAAMLAADVTFVVSDFERELLHRLLPFVDVRVLGNIHSPTVAKPTLANRSAILFVGGYRHPPNVDAALWAANEIMPLVRAQVPDATLRLVGSHLTPEVAELESEYVHVEGWVPDLTPEYASARVVIAPLRYGAGVKGKVGEAIEHAVPVVGTSMAFEGMNLLNGIDVLVANETSSFAEAIVRLMTDDELWTAMAGHGQSALLEKFSPTVARRVLEDALATSPPSRHLGPSSALLHPVGASTDAAVV